MKILFCSDGSGQAEKAVRFGAPIAAAIGAEAVILGIAAQKTDEKALDKALKRAREICRELDLHADVISRVGKPVDEIVKCTEEAAYDLVVIGAVRDYPFWKLVGGVWSNVKAHGVKAYKIIEAVEPPVLTVLGSRRSLRRILVCTGGRTYIDKAIEITGLIAQKIKATVDLFHVMPEPPPVYAELIRLEDDVHRLLESNSDLGRSLSHQKDMLKELGVFGRVRLHHGQVVQELLKELQATQYDLVVAGSSQVSDRLRKLALGNVSREIVNTVELPVLVMRTTEPGGVMSRLKERLEGLTGRFKKKAGE